MYKIARSLLNLPVKSQAVKAALSYVQGQSPKRNTREYFYYIDHQGQLFMDDAKVKNFISCFKEKDFLAFFFSRIRLNRTGRYEDDFPYFSPCGREKNYIRCDDLPIVFTHILKQDSESDDKDFLSYGYAGDKLTFPFQPEHLCMLPDTGRVYHPAPDKTGGVGLVKSKLAIEISQYFGYNKPSDTSILQPPDFFTWGGKTYLLSNQIFNKVLKKES
uniref:UPF0598 protein CG30010 n=1 Tax=Ciona intestinalis TaxID=7719 RepID=H2XQA6_CIOIN|nr:UPF0598 protein CG30010 isoform X2 [Ciona intestinalis]|eukprot:XP_009859298.1 UPF0598 protein CG30010 isoform X2 [Ciona intestinalis]